MIPVLLSLAIAAAPTIIEDDFQGAMSKARGTKKLVFVEVWNKWCPPCIQMKDEVLTQPTLGDLEEKLVFVTINTESDKNSAFVSKYQTNVFPMVYFFDPNTERIVHSFFGSADERRIRSQTATALQRAANPNGSTAESNGPPNVSGALDPAALRPLIYLEAVDTKKPNIEGISDAFITLKRVGAYGPCVGEAERLATAITKLPDHAIIVTAGLECAGQRRDSKAEKLVALAEALLTKSKQPRLTSEDVGGLYTALAKSFQDETQAQAFGDRWLTHVVESLRGAKTTAERMSYNADYVFAALTAKKPAGAIAHLTRMEKEEPKSYNPPYLLGRLYMGNEKYKDAIDAGKRALARTSDPEPRNRIYNQLLIPGYAKLGDVANQRATLKTAIEETKHISEKSSRDDYARTLEDELKKLDDPAHDAGTAPAT